MQTCVQVLKMVVCCHFNTSKPFNGYRLGHVLLKVYQYVITNEKVACKLHCTSTNLPKLKSINVSNDKRNLAMVSIVGEGVCGFKP